MAEVTKKGIVVNPSTGSGDTTLKVKASSNIIAEIPWNDGTGDKVYVNYNPNEKSQTINITSDFNFGNQPRDLIITIQTNSPNIDPDLQVKFSLLVTQQVDNTRVVATFDSIKSLYSNISSQYVKES
jgi:hypothetical protein